MGKKPLSKQPIKPISLVAKGQKVTAPLATEKSAAQLTQSGEIFSVHVPVKPPALVEPDSKTLPVIKPNSVLQVEVDKPLTKDAQITAEMYATGNGSPLCQALMMALKHEGKPSYLSDDKYLQRFARYGWDSEEDLQAEKLLRLWQQAPDSDDIVPDDDRVFTESANIAITTFKRQYNAIYQAMRRGEMTPAEARFSLEYLQRQEARVKAMLNALQDESTIEERVALLEIIYGYNIDGTYDVEQISRLARANLMIIEYLDRITGRQGYQSFVRHWSENPDGTQIVVQLGAEERTGGSSFGLVPQPESSEADRNIVFLGSDVAVSTIVHEFGHHLDRWYKLSSDERFIDRGITGFLSQAGESGFSPIYDATNDRYNLSADLIGDALQGFAAKQFLPAEFMADLFMTAVLASRNEEVFSLNIDSFTSSERLQLEATLGSAFILCEDGTATVTLNGQNRTIPCGWQVVGWQDPTIGTQIDTLFAMILGE